MKTVRLSLLALAIGACAAPSPSPAGRSEDGHATVALGKQARFGSLLTVPLRIEEDSRCPTGVQCIQAGTVRIAVRISGGGARSENILTLGKPLELAGAGWLSLAAVCPYPAHPGRIERASYRFTLAFRRDGPPAPLDLACSR
jgi:hypothetical protein